MEDKLEPLLYREEIASAVQRLASDLDKDYIGRPLVMVGILKGAFIFLADLVRQMEVPISAIEFMRLSSYEHGTTTSGIARVVVGVPKKAVRGKDVILVEDIVDTGITTAAAFRYLHRWKPASIKLCALLSKPSRRRVPVAIDYLGLTVPDVFVAGYGTDKDQLYRQIPDIYNVGA